MRERCRHGRWSNTCETCAAERTARTLAVIFLGIASLLYLVLILTKSVAD